MRVLITSCVFPPEPVVSAQTSAQIAQALCRQGHKVTVLAPFPNRPEGKLYPGYKRHLFHRERREDGIQIIRCFATLSPRSNLLSRFLENISFGLSGGWAALTVSRPDIIYSNTWPLFATGLLYLVAKLRRIPLVISIQDVYPESLISQARTTSDGPLIRLMRWIDGVMARGAHSLLVISPKFAEIYRNGRRVDPVRIHIIPNWGRQDSIQLDGCDADRFRAQRNIPPEAFLMAYGGNIGVAAGVETVIQAFQYLDRPDFHLLVAGAGSQLATCQHLAAKVAPDQITFHTPWPAEETSPVLCSADILILPTKGDQSLVSVPSKLITYMLAARPVLALAAPQSDIAQIISQSHGGWVIEPDRPDLLAAKIRDIAALDQTDLYHRGRSARRYAVEHLTEAACLPRVLDIIKQAIQ